ncbi:MAG: hypothetical protein H6766_00405 [Candidatus Peribacteria bacterium]|nr:MAG: hypothetical protein H6766_00405 [Candidatus Peribacteria bacterium]
MRGYPIGQSPICEGDFCGGNNTTTAEYLQVITNILGQYSYNNIQAPWLAIQAWANQTTTLNTYYQTIVSSAYKQCPT